MTGESKLRSVRSASEEEAGARPQPSAPRQSQRPSSAVILLALALMVALALLVWSRIQLGGQIEVLAAEAQSLRSTIAERERVIDAHRGRLKDVRTYVDRLGALLDKPLPE